MNNGASDVETYLDNSERRYGNHWSNPLDYHNTFTNQVVFLCIKKDRHSTKVRSF